MSPDSQRLCAAAFATPTELLSWLDAAQHAAQRGLGLPASHGQGPVRLAFAARPGTELVARLEAARARVRDGVPAPDLHYATGARAVHGLAVLFPGQGSQYPRMLAGLRRELAPLRAALDQLDAIAQESYGSSLLALIDGDGDALLTDTYFAQAGLGLVCAALSIAFRQLGVRARFSAGHSYGELVALLDAGVLDAATLFELTKLRGRLMREAGQWAPGGMLALACGADEAGKLLRESGARAEIANLNTSRQTVVAGPEGALRQLEQTCGLHSVRAVRLKTACAFHSSAMAPAGAALRGEVEELVGRGKLGAPDVRVMSNRTGQPYPSDVRAIPALLSEQLVCQVRWQECCASLHAEGARVFLELGPGRVLARTLQTNLDDPSCVVLSSDPVDSEPRAHLLALCGALYAEGVPLTPSALGDNLIHPTHSTTLHGVETNTSPARRGAEVVKQPVHNGEAVPALLAHHSELVRRYLELSSRVLDATLARPELMPGQSALSRFIELNAEVTSRYLALQQDALPLMLTDGASPQPTLLPAPAPRLSGGTPVAARKKDEPAPAPAAPQGGTLAWLRGELSTLTGFPEHALGSEVSLSELGIDSLAQAALLERIALRVPEARSRGRALLSARTLDELVRLLDGDGKQASPKTNDVSAGAESWDVWLQASISSLTGFPRDRVRSELTFEELGIDSLAFASLLELAAKRSQSIKSRARDLFGARTVGEAVRVLEGSEAQTDAPAPSAPAPAAEGVSEALLRALSARTPDGLETTESLLDAQPGLSSGSTREALSSIAPVWPAVALAGEQLASCVSVRDMTRTLDELARVAPLEDALCRYELTEVVLPRPHVALPAQVILLGRAESLLDGIAEAGADQGVRVLRVLHDAAGFVLPGGVHIPFEQTAKLSAALDLLDAGKERAGVLFVAGSPGEGRPLAEALELDVVALFALAKALEASALSRHLSVVSLSDAGEHTLGARGVARALAQEWRESPLSVSAVRARDDADAHTLLAVCFGETCHTDYVVRGAEIGRERLLKRELAPQSPAAAPLLGRDDVVLLVGGAVGIAAEMAIELAARFGCTIAAVGRTPYEGSAPFAELGDTELGSALHAQLSRSGQEVSAEKLRTELARVKRQRSVHATAQRLRALGVRFVYRQADARDAQALSRAIADIQRELGRIDVVLHAAGVVEDALLAGKSFASFRRVLDTKVRSAETLRRALASAEPRHVVLLSSLVGHTGNAGQSDYCAANEVLDALAQRWSRETSRRVVAMAWSVWDEVGLASRGVREVLQREGMHLIGRDEGVARFLRELSECNGPSWVLFASPRGVALASGAARMGVES